MYQGTADQAELFFGTLWPGARAVADPDAELYAAFGVRRGGVRQMFGPRVIACGARATLAGHRAARVIGDPWTLPRVVAVRDRAVIWEHDGRHAGDHPDVAAIPALIAAPADGGRS